MKRFFSFLAALCLFLGAAAQEKIKPIGLKTCEAVPDLVLEKVLNNNGQPLKLSEFKGKLLILDFWATSCGARIQAMPRLDSLQNLYKEQLVILPVTTEKAEKITAFQHNNAFLKGRKFRTVVEDKALHALFPHRLLPHEVWIDGTGKVLGLTEATDINSATIENALDGKGIAAPGKQDVLDYDRNKPLLVQGNGGSDTAYWYRSVITPAIKGLPSGAGFTYDSVKRLTVVKATNISARRLYALAYKGLRDLPDTAVDLGKITGLFCYELDLPSTSPALVRKSIREDLDRFFGVRSEFTGTTFRLLPVSRDEDADGGPLTL